MAGEAFPLIFGSLPFSFIKPGRRLRRPGPEGTAKRTNCFCRPKGKIPVNLIPVPSGLSAYLLLISFGRTDTMDRWSACLPKRRLAGGNRAESKRGEVRGESAGAWWRHILAEPLRPQSSRRVLPISPGCATKSTDTCGTGVQRAPTNSLFYPVR